LVTQGFPTIRAHGTARSGELRLDLPGQGQIDVVAAQDQVVSNGNPLETGASFDVPQDNQGEIGGTAAHIADQDQLAGLNVLTPVVFMLHEPAVKSRQGFFEQNDGIDAGRFSRF